MKKILFVGVAAVAMAAVSAEKASAWCKFRFGVGLNVNYESGGDKTFLWGAWQSYDFPHSQYNHNTTLPFSYYDQTHAYTSPPPNCGGPGCAMGGMMGGGMPAFGAATGAPPFGAATGAPPFEQGPPPAPVAKPVPAPEAASAPGALPFALESFGGDFGFGN